MLTLVYKSSAQLSLWHCPTATTATHNDHRVSLVASKLTSSQSTQKFPSCSSVSGSLQRQFCCSNTAKDMTPSLNSAILWIKAAALYSSASCYPESSMKPPAPPLVSGTKPQPQEKSTYSVFFRSICFSSVLNLSRKFYYKTLGCKTQKFHTRMKQ